MKHRKFSIFFILAALLLCAKMQAQTKVATGTVTDSAGHPIPEIVIAEKGLLSNHTLTDVHGYFSLSFKKTGNKIVVSGTGFKTQDVPVSGNDLHIIAVSDIDKLNDVVVVGYGKTKKITLTGAVSSISGDEIRQSPSASLQNALAGRLPGLFSQQGGGQPGADAATIQIRGISALNANGNIANANPLILVDDVEFQYSQLQQIDPNEVESVTILKDAAVTAIYGVRGANGVLIVTTRRGKAGRPELSVSNEYAFQFPTARPTTLNGYNTLQLYQEQLLEQGQNPAAVAPQFFGGNNLSYYKNNSDPYGHPMVNWWDVLMRNYSNNDHFNLSVSGGSQLIRYAITMDYFTQGGIFKDFSKDQGYNDNYFYNRYNFRSNIDITPTKTLKIRMDISGRFGTTNTPNDKNYNNGGTTFQYLWDGELSTFGFPVYNPNGTWGGSTNTAIKFNPVPNLMYSGYSRAYNNNYSLVGSVVQQLDFITKGLSATAMLSYASDYNYNKSLGRTINNKQYPGTYYYDGNAQTYKNLTSGLYSINAYPLSRSFYPQASGYLLNMQARLDYARSFGNHNVSALFGYNQNSNNTNTVSSNVVTPGTPTNYLGYIAKVGYNFAQKYLLDLNAGYNGSDRFGSGKKYGLFPAASIGWNIAEESFFKKNIFFISLLKLRASYGLTGSDNISGFNYLYQQTYGGAPGGTGYNFGQTSTPVGGLVEGALGNANITWSKKKTTNIGMDVQMFNNALSITADYFHDYNYDQLTTYGNIPVTLGVGLPPANIGITKNNGYEVQITYKKSTGKLFYSVTGNVSYAKNTVVYMSEAPAKYPYLMKTGHSIGAIQAYTWTGQYFQNVQDIINSPNPVGTVPMSNMFPGALKLADINGDGIIDANDNGYQGNFNPIPRYMGGLTGSVSYKGFDLSFLFQGAFGGYMNFKNLGLYSYVRPDKQASVFQLGRWTPENAKTATYPSLANSTTNGYVSSFWVRKSDYIRFKNFEFGYTFSPSLIKKWGLKRLRVYTNGYNMALVYSAMPMKLDPETSNGASLPYPQQRIFNFGIQAGL